MRTRLLAALFVAAGCSQGGGGPNPDGGTNDMTPGAPPDLATLDPGVISRTVHTVEEAETHVAVAPNGFVAVAYIGIQPGGSTNGYRFSRDDGATWEDATWLDSPVGRETSDPVLAVDKESNFYMTWIEFHRNNQGQPYDMHVYAAKAPAGTTTFATPQEVTQDPPGQYSYDKPWAMVTNDDQLLITYARTSTGGIFAAKNPGNDLMTWNIATIVEDGGFRNLVFPCQPSTGMRTYATYHAGGGIGLRWSDDAGATWPDANKTAVADMAEGRPAFDDPTCAAEGQEVWVTYGLSNDGFSTTNSAALYSVRLAHSADGGKTIDSRVDAGDAAAASFFMHPYLTRESSGALDLTYYAGGANPDPMGSFRYARSTDGGKTFGPSLAVKSPLTFTGDRASGKWVGDYTGMAWARGSIYLAYVYNMPTSSHVAFFRTASPPGM